MMNGRVTVVGLAMLCAMAGSASAASHREAPLISQDPTADNTDFYLFRSWNDPSKVVLILNVIPGQEPGSGPNYFNFSDEVLYAVHIDTDQDGAENVAFEVRFTTEFRGVVADLSLPLSYVALPPITALDGAGSEGLGMRQSYTVTEVRGALPRDRTELNTGSFFAVPSNAGPRTYPDYEALAAKGIYALSNGGKVFAGQRDETFSIDLGATFDTLNFRRQPPILSAAEDASNSTNPFGVDLFSGFNVNSIAIELPISALTSASNAVIGAYASTSRQRVTKRKGAPLNFQQNDDQDDVLRGSGRFVQVSRLANPLVNEVIIGTPVKDIWNGSDPRDEATFLGFYTTSRLAIAINTVFGTTFPTTDRNDIVKALLKYPSQGDSTTCSKDDPCAELLRLDLSVPPTQPAQQQRLGVLAGDMAGWPNGRRPNDDVTDIALRVVAGALLGPVPALGDGVNYNLGAPGAGTADGAGYGTTAGNALDVTANGIAVEFPYLPTPHDGRDRRHVDCGEPGGNPCDGVATGGSVAPTAPKPPSTPGNGVPVLTR
jgi:hypothetical protein